jgi:hypothetical protein
MAAETAPWAEDLALGALALARAFASGATMWCVAPQWPEHARHIAVEFVHPVIMGKRALPAVAIATPDAVSAVRAVAGSGDILVAVGDRDEPSIIDLMRRAPAWGVESVWIGRGPRPERGAARHLFWVDDPGRDAVRDGGLVLLYHVLWELTHVCFEHPGLLEPPDDCTDEHCITCSDEGTLGEVVVTDGSCDATVRTARGVEEIDVTLVAPVEPGALVLVHAGTAISVVDGDDGHA